MKTYKQFNEAATEAQVRAQNPHASPEMVRRAAERSARSEAQRKGNQATKAATPQKALPAAPGALATRDKQAPGALATRGEVKATTPDDNRRFRDEGKQTGERNPVPDMSGREKMMQDKKRREEGLRKKREGLLRKDRQATGKALRKAGGKIRKSFMKQLRTKGDGPDFAGSGTPGTAVTVERG